MSRWEKFSEGKIKIKKNKMTKIISILTRKRIIIIIIVINYLLTTLYYKNYY